MRPEELVNAFAADVSVVDLAGVTVSGAVGQEGSTPACRCYRCGVLLTARDVRADEGAWGIRPACPGCVT